jgi:hypothetical protein
LAEEPANSEEVLFKKETHANIPFEACSEASIRTENPPLLNSGGN